MDFAAVLMGLGIQKLITASLFILYYLSSEYLKVFYNFNEAHPNSKWYTWGTYRNLFNPLLLIEVSLSHCSLNAVAKFNRLKTSPSSLWNTKLYFSFELYSVKTAGIHLDITQLRCNLSKTLGLVPSDNEKCQEI